MGCRKLDIRAQFYFVGAEEKPHSHEGTADYTQKTAYSRFSHTVISNYRYYSPELGRWLSREPLEEEGSLNLYSYVDNSPMNWIDYLGLFKLKFDDSGGKWTPKEKLKVRSIFRKISRKIKKRIKEIKKKIKELDKCKCNPDLVARLEDLIKTLNKISKGIDGKSQKMTLKKDDLGGSDGTSAKALFKTPLIPIYEINLWTTVINNNAKMDFFKQDEVKQMEDLFHETSHDYGTKDPKEKPVYENTAGVIDDFMHNSTLDGFFNQMEMITNGHLCPNCNPVMKLHNKKK